jgi:CBS domain-containing protein
VSEVLQPVLSKEAGVPIERIFTAKWNARVLDVVNVMRLREYTHVPILDEGRVAGVFSENTMFCALAAHNSLIVEEGTAIANFGEFVPLSRHVSEHFDFVAHDVSLESVAQLFQERLKHQERLGAVFLTDTGNEAGQLLGLVTAWDIAGTTLLQ